jgi:hypothetical protein
MSSKTNEKEVKMDAIGTFWLTSENVACFNQEFTTYVVEVLVKYHKLPEIVKEKETELEHLMDFETFEEVPDVGQNKVESQWVITKKHDGQKTTYKGMLVAKVFHKEIKP